jgi:hypothetical protein
MRVPGFQSLALAFVLVVALPAWADKPRTVLDQETGSTLVIAADPWLFARDQPLRAAHARDYVGVYPVEINTAGKRKHFLVVFYWSTVERRGEFAGATPRIDLAVDDRRVVLSPGTETPRDLGISKWPFTPPGKGSSFRVYAIDEVLIRQLATAQLVELRLPDDVDRDTEAVPTWKDGRKSIADFVAEALQ